MSCDINNHCSRHFRYIDLIQCGETCHKQGFKNQPEAPASWRAIEKLASEILDPVYDQFGTIQITYGFCSHKLGLAILKNAHPHIAPELDQHAAYELNSREKRICERGGMACDFIIPNEPASKVAVWVVENCPFDRLYFYGENRPLHVSFSNSPAREICWMKTSTTGRRQPYRYTVEKFIELMTNNDSRRISSPCERSPGRKASS